MLAMELQARGVTVGLIDWLALNVLPRVVPAHLHIWISSAAYIHAYAHLNTVVYQHPEKGGKVLSWKSPTRLMCKLLTGDMGIDVLHAMRAAVRVADGHIEG
jgi:hypothetical protein